MALGVQNKFSWSQVALGAISSVAMGAAASIIKPEAGAALSTLQKVGRAAVGSVISQGVGVATGLQQKFSWKSVAASALGAAVGDRVGQKLNENNIFSGAFGEAGGDIARATVVGLAAGATASITSGGRINLVRIATDAFGNALGDSIVDGMQPTPAARPGQLGSGTYNLDAEVNDLLSPMTGVSVQPKTPAPQFGELGSGTFGLDADLGAGFMTVDPTRPLPRSVRAGDFGGSLERIARAENPGASQREINNYVGQLFEVNGITNARRIGADQSIALPDAYMPMASTGLQQYGQDIAVGEQMRQANTARTVNANTVVTRDGITAGDLDLLSTAYALHDANLAAQTARRNFVGPLQPIQATGEIRALLEMGFLKSLASGVIGQPVAFARYLAGGDPVNPITEQFENFNGADRKLLAIAGVVPLPQLKGAQGISVLKRALVSGAGDLSSTALRGRVLANIAESQAARASSKFDIHLARSDQIRWGYAADDWGMTTLPKGSKAYGGIPGQSAYYTAEMSLANANLSRTSLFQSLQVSPHRVFGHRPQMGVYEVMSDIRVPYGIVRANPSLGPGGATQYFVRDYSTQLRLLDTINLGH